MNRASRQNLIPSLLLLGLAPVASATLPRPATPITIETAADSRGSVETPGVDPLAPTPRYRSISVAPLESKDTFVAWLFKATKDDLDGMDGITFFLKGDDQPHHVDIVLRTSPSKTAFRSRAFLRTPYWHRVFLPFSEFSAGMPAIGGRVDRFKPNGAIQIGVELLGPTASPTILSIDAFGLTTWDEVNQTLGWPTYMPPSHGFPPYIEDYSEEHRFSASQGATLSSVEIPGFPCPRFRKGVRLRLPTNQATASHPLSPREALEYFEGFAFWIKGDGADHLVEMRAGEPGDLRYRFPFYVKGKSWKLLFAEFENFRDGNEPFAVEESAEPVIAISVKEPAGATLTLGPIRLGYEK